MPLRIMARESTILKIEPGAYCPSMRGVVAVAARSGGGRQDGAAGGPQRHDGRRRAHLAEDVLRELLELRIQGGFQRGSRLRSRPGTGPGGRSLGSACFSSAVRPAFSAKTWMPSLPRSWASYCCWSPPVPVVSPALSAPPDFSICSAFASAAVPSRARAKVRVGASGRESGDGAGAGDLADLRVGDGPAVLAQGDGGNEGLGAGRLDLLGVGRGVHSHQLGKLGGGVGGVGGSPAAGLSMPTLTTGR